MAVAPEFVDVALSAEQVADFAYAAGFRGEGLRVAVAVAMAESNGRTGATGDVTIQDAKWGPSIGLWQIRSLKAQLATGQQRDGRALYDPAFNARSAYEISGHGASFKLWSTYTNGSYRSHLTEAGNAAASVESRGGSAGSVTQVQGDVSYPVPAPTVLDVTPVALKNPNNLTIRRQTVSEQVGVRWTDGNVEMSADEITQISITFCDEDYAIWQADWRGFGAEAELDGWLLDLAGVSGGKRNGIWFTSLRFWPRGVVSLRMIKGITRQNVSAGEWIGAEAELRGMRFMNFEAHGVRRSSIAPDDSGGGASLGSLSTLTSDAQTKAPEKAYDTMQRLAKEDGCRLFITPDALVYGKPSVLARAMSYLDCGFRGSVNNDPALDWKNLEADLSMNIASNDTRTRLSIDKIGTVYLPRWRGERVRPGMAIRFPGFNSYDDMKYLVTRVRWPFDAGIDDVAIDFERPVDPTPQASSNTLGDPVVGQLGQSANGLSKGTRTASAFVAFAQSQKGKRYVYGAHPDPSNPNPDSFDCSSLVQWAAAQVGIKVPRTSGAQLGACDEITIEEAAQTRGALIFRNGAGEEGHVVISLGDGRSTIEARGAAYGVVSAPISGRGFDTGGLIRGMTYNGPVGTAIFVGGRASVTVSDPAGSGTTW